MSKKPSWSLNSQANRPTSRLGAISMSAIERWSWLNCRSTRPAVAKVRTPVALALLILCSAAALAQSGAPATTDAPDAPAASSGGESSLELGRVTLDVDKRTGAVRRVGWEVMPVTDQVPEDAAFAQAAVTLDALYRGDVEDGSLEQLLLAPVPLPWLLAVRVLVHWATTALPLLLLTPVLAQLLYLPTDLLPVLMGSLHNAGFGGVTDGVNEFVDFRSALPVARPAPPSRTPRSWWTGCP